MPYKDLEKKREAQRRFYRNHSTKCKADILTNKQNMVKWFQEYRNTLQCIKCGEAHGYCLEFHHPNGRGEQDFCISLLPRKGWGKARIIAEIAKCDVLCRNCHAEVHWLSGNFHGCNTL